MSRYLTSKNSWEYGVWAVSKGNLFRNWVQTSIIAQKSSSRDFSQFTSSYVSHVTFRYSYFLGLCLCITFKIAEIIALCPYTTQQKNLFGTGEWKQRKKVMQTWHYIYLLSSEDSRKLYLKRLNFRFLYVWNSRGLEGRFFFKYFFFNFFSSWKPSFFSKYYLFPGPR